MTARDPEARLETLQRVLEALAHPARRQVLLTIHFRGEVSAGAIASRFAHSWPTTTRHLRVLEAAGLLTREKRGREQLYRANPAALEEVRAWLAWFEPEPRS